MLCQHVAAHWRPHWHYDWQLSPKAVAKTCLSSTHTLHTHLCTHTHTHILFLRKLVLSLKLLFFYSKNMRIRRARRYGSALFPVCTWSACMCACPGVGINTAKRGQNRLQGECRRIHKNKPHLIIWIGTSFYCVMWSFMFEFLPFWVYDVKLLASRPTREWASKTFCSGKD